MKINWERFAVKKTGHTVYALSESDVDALVLIVQKLPIEWHRTTPKRFLCQSKCFSCCSMCWFNKDELLRLPQRYHSKLVDGHVKTINGKCPFYNERESYHCAIAEYRPLRCLIYPFNPILDTKRNAIVILAQDIMIWGGVAKEEPASLCYGLGSGEDVSGKAEELCRSYMLYTILEQSYSRFLWMGDADSFIDKRALALRENPLYKTFAECYSARVNAVRMFGKERFCYMMTEGLV